MIEYIVKKDINLEALTTPRFNSDIFKSLYINYRDVSFKKDSSFTREAFLLAFNKGCGCNSSFSEDVLSNLISCGFVEEMDDDIIVKLGDCFLVEGYMIYRLMKADGNKVILLNIDGKSRWSDPVRYSSSLKLSDFVNKDRLKFFKPIKIKITIDK